MSGPSRFVRRSLSSVPRYVPGRAVAPGPGGRTFKLSSNENPFPPVPAVADAVRAAAEATNRYPDMFATGLAARIGDLVGLPAEQVVVGTGSVGVLGQVLQATCEPGDEVVMAWRSFEAYPITIQVAGARPVPVPLTAEGRHDFTAMAAAVTERTKVVLVCSPNNPTGPAVRRDELLDFLDSLAGRCLVVLDEAYAEFVRDPDAADGPHLARTRDDVVVLRTFSKAHGLATLRVGYGLTSQPVADAMRAAAVPFGVSGVAQQAAMAALDATLEIEAQVEVLVAERHRVVSALAEAGWRVPDAQGNFVWLALGEDTDAFVAASADRGVAVRGFAPDGVRCSIGEPEGNDLLLEVARDARWEAHRGA